MTEIGGSHLLHEPDSNKSTAFTEEERDALGLRGLLPPHVSTQDEQVARIMGNYRRETTDLGRYAYLSALQDRNERLFFRVITDHIEEMMPIVYTPTVGEASQEFSSLFRRARGLYVTAEDRGRVAQILGNWHTTDVQVIVVTDGERILGLGDLGANGMGIPIGKLTLYTAVGGINPSRCLPVMIDVGTNNEALREDPLYLGLRQARVTGAAYDELLDEFVEGVQEAFPDALIQFEDFETQNAYRLLHRYRDRVLTFNDDIQGTAAVALGGLYAAIRITDVPLTDMTVMFLGAGSAATGIADLLVSALVAEGLDEAAARRRCWFVDSEGLVVSGRDRLAEHKLRYAHDHEPLNFAEAVAKIRPTALLGATGHGGSFTRDIIGLMAEINPRPIIFALSNPTSKAECTAEQAYGWSQGRAVFASGSPFDSVEYEGRRHVPGQGNNVYVFPGIGLGAVATRATRITEEMFLVAARTLADSVSTASLEMGSIYPPLGEIRAVSIAIAEAVAGVAHSSGLARAGGDDDIARQVRDHVWSFAYD